MYKLREQKGAFAPFVAVLIVLLILAVGLVVDLGHIHNVRTELQRAVDAAALAGAGQLNGGSDQETRAVDAAEAMAEQNNVDAEKISVEDDNVVATPGSWDDQALGTPAEQRYVAGGSPTNAIRVEATRQVDHWFFFPIPGTEVTADAIAVNIFKEETIPISLVSCIPTDGSYLKPGNNVCDIAYFAWASDNNDTVGWTTLTNRPAKKPNIEKLFSRDGLNEFARIVYGNNGKGGLEYEDVDPGPQTFDENALDTTSSLACNNQNVGTSILCGLGDEFDPDAAPTISDVLQDYGAANSLPRWYHDSDISDIWSVEGILADGDPTRMKALRKASIDDDYTGYESTYGTLDPVYKDGRFEKMISLQGAPLYPKALQYAGYPLVAVNNGRINSALKTFLEGNDELEGVLNEAMTSFRSSLIAENEPFDSGNSDNSYGRGFTMQLTMPVVFLGECDGATFINDLPYIGVANVLVTRVWRNQNDFYDVGSGKQVTATLTSVPGDSGSECVFPNFNPDHDPPAPPTDTENKFSAFGWSEGQAFEALIQPPTRGEKTETGIRSIFLVK